MTMGNGFAGTIATAWRVYFELVRRWTQEVAEKRKLCFRREEDTVTTIVPFWCMGLHMFAAYKCICPGLLTCCCLSNQTITGYRRDVLVVVIVMMEMVMVMVAAVLVLVLVLVLRFLMLVLVFTPSFCFMT